MYPGRVPRGSLAPAILCVSASAHCQSMVLISLAESKTAAQLKLFKYQHGRVAVTAMKQDSRAISVNRVSRALVLSWRFNLAGLRVAADRLTTTWLEQWMTSSLQPNSAHNKVKGFVDRVYISIRALTWLYALAECRWIGHSQPSWRSSSFTLRRSLKSSLRLARGSSSVTGPPRVFSRLPENRSAWLIAIFLALK